MDASHFPILTRTLASRQESLFLVLLLGYPPGGGQDPHGLLCVRPQDTRPAPAPLVWHPHRDGRRPRPPHARAGVRTQTRDAAIIVWFATRYSLHRLRENSKI